MDMAEKETEWVDVPIPAAALQFQQLCRRYGAPVLVRRDWMLFKQLSAPRSAAVLYLPRLDATSAQLHALTEQRPLGRRRRRRQ